MLELSMEIPTVKLKEWSSLCDLDFVLAHKVLNDSEYAQHFQNRRFGRDVLLDNSTHEFGSPLPMDSLQLAAELCRADILIAPDIVNPKIDDAQIEQNIKWAEETCRAVRNVSIGVVLCGHTLDQREEYISRTFDAGAKVLCFSFHDLRRIDWFYDFLYHETFSGWKHIHILGVASLNEMKHWWNISESYKEKRFSIDTSKALKFGVAGQRIDTLTSLRGGPIRSKEVLDLKTFTPEQEGVVKKNVEILRSICTTGDY